MNSNVPSILATSGLWILAGVGDLARRRVSIPVLLALTILSLVGHSPIWWIVAAPTLLWPWRDRAWLLACPALVAGFVTGRQAPALALSMGATAWSLGWWGGADGILLLALALRHGPAGLLAGALAPALLGLSLMVRRRQSLSRLLLAWQDLVALRPLDVDVPVEVELPAAVALALAGLTMEGVKLCQIVFG